MEKDTWSYKIENINHILIGMVVCLHCSLYNYLSGNKASEYYINSALRFLNVIFDAAVPTFFVISAYLYYKNFTTKKYISKLKSRVFSLVIPYFLWSTIMYVYYALITVLISGASVTIESSVELSWKGAFISILTAKSALTMWFVRVLVVFAVISPIFYVLIKIFKKKIEQVLCFVFLVFFTIILKEQYSHAFYWIPCHYLGGY